MRRCITQLVLLLAIVITIPKTKPCPYCDGCGQNHKGLNDFLVAPFAINPFLIFPQPETSFNPNCLWCDGHGVLDSEYGKVLKQDPHKQPTLAP